MATTTNYGWTTPDDTALVKDGAAAIRTLGTSVDTTTKNLNPETTLGDIAYRSSTANVKTRLGIGSTGNVLTVAGGVPSWAAPAAGGMTLLSTTTLSSTLTTVSSISQDYNSLFVIIKKVDPASGSNEIRVLPNGSTTASYMAGVRTPSASGVNYRVAGCIQLPLGYDSTLAGNTNNMWSLTINNYTNTSSYKSFNFSGIWQNGNNGTSGGIGGGGINTDSAITSLGFDAEGATMNGGTVLIYGVK